MKVMTTTTWLHLSDLHFKSGKAYEQFNRKIVLDKLWDDIKYVIDSKKLLLDFIAFTGDVAYHGRADEYELSVERFFEPLLQTTGLKKDRLFIVPGNHDIDRSRMDPFYTESMRGLLKDRDRVNQFLSGEDHAKEMVFKKFEGFEKFFNQFYGGDLQFDPEHFFYTKVLKFGANKNIGILGLNSAWMSGVVTDKEGEVLDKGNLLIGEWQIAKALEEVSETDLRIVLFHHPIADLHDTDASSVRRLFGDCDILLHGHLHLNSQSRIAPLSGDLTMLASGAIYQERSFPNSYHFAKITYGSQLNGNIIFRKYYSETDNWSKDIVTTGEKNDGEATFWNPNISYKSHHKKSGRGAVEEITIPTIVVAMDDEEAEEFVNSPTFNDLRDVFPDKEEFLSRYKSNRDHWVPFGNGTSSIKIILESLSKNHPIEQNDTTYKLCFEFNTDLFFDEKGPFQIQKLLEQTSCVFFIDSVSMLNSKVCAKYLGYNIAQEKFISFILSPVNHREDKTNSLITERIKIHLDKFLYEHDEKLNPRLGLLVGNEIELKRSVKTNLGRVVAQENYFRSWNELLPSILKVA